jgi:hypothetical protein
VASPLASWYRRAEFEAAAERAVAEAVLAAGAEVPRPRNRPLPGDPARLRGLQPCACPAGSAGRSAAPAPTTKSRDVSKRYPATIHVAAALGDASLGAFPDVARVTSDDDPDEVARRSGA